MKTVFLFLFTIALGSFAYAQRKTNYEESLKFEADKYFFEEQYNLAVQYYQELANLSDQNAEINYQLAECYRKIFDYTQAEAYYLKAHYQSPKEFPLALYYFALMLKLNGEFADAINYFDQFIAADLNNKELKEFQEQAVVDRAGCEMAGSETAGSLYTLQTENINSSFNDYAPALIDSNTLVITSGRIQSNRESIDERYGEAFTDNYYFVRNGAAWTDRTRQVFAITNTRYNDGSGHFNAQGTKYYFTVCGKEGSHCRIFLSNWKENKWTEPTALNDNINFKSFEAKHPAVSQGGDTLLFSSNRPGGAGGYDIWMSINAGNENWGPAMNLGSTINTKLNELSPAFTRYAHIFFIASDGHQNYGGLDLYMVKRFSNGTIALYNLDFPFNSNRDDCFISLADNKIYFSSNREGGIGGFDIYSTHISSIVSFISRLGLKKKDSRSDVKLNSRSEKVKELHLLTARNEDRIEYEQLTYEKKQLVNRMLRNRQSGVSEKAADYSGITEAEFISLQRIAETQYKAQEMQKRFAQNFLSRLTTTAGKADAEFSVNGILQDSLSNKPLADRKILLMDESGEVLKVTHSNAQGKFRFTNIGGGRNLYLRLETTGSSEKPQVDNLLIAEEEQLITSLENIYFDFDRYTLRPEAQQVLQELAQQLKAHPSAQVEIYAFADDRGADQYNMTLTEKRGQAVLSYLAAQGVDQTGIAVTAKGRQVIINGQDEVLRQYNRRVEFFVNGHQINSTRLAETYILKGKTDWDTIAKSTGINKEQLKSLNGTKSNQLAIYQPVRLPLTSKPASRDLFFTFN